MVYISGVLVACCLFAISLAYEIIPRPGGPGTWGPNWERPKYGEGRINCTLPFFQRLFGHSEWADRGADDGWEYDSRDLELRWEMAQFASETNGPSLRAPWENPLDPDAPHIGLFAKIGLGDICVAMGHIGVKGEPDLWGTRFLILTPSYYDDWARKILAVGNEDFASDFNWADMASGLDLGYTVVSTESKYALTGGNGSQWSQNRKEAMEDWGWRSLHATIETTKQAAIGSYMPELPTFDEDLHPERFFNHLNHERILVYFMGCGNGARQGLKEAEKFPTSLDALLLAAPTWDMLQWSVWNIRMAQLNSIEDRSHISPRAIPFLAKEIIRQCDKDDRTLDGLITWQKHCKPNFSALLCAKDQTSFCFTKHQIERIRLIYGLINPKEAGLPPYHGLSYGSEFEWEALLAGPPDRLALEYYRYFVVNDPKWDWRISNASLAISLDPPTHPLENGNPGGANVVPERLLDFKQMGGKIIMYHGTADTVVPLASTNELYRMLLSLDESNLQYGDTDWIRYYHIPGMKHCGGHSVVKAPWFIAGPGQTRLLEPVPRSVPSLRSSKYDVLLAFDRWISVDKYAGPRQHPLIATTWKDQRRPDSGVQMQRPLCQFGQRPVYPYGFRSFEPGRELASSWHCRLD